MRINLGSPIEKIKNFILCEFFVHKLAVTKVIYAEVEHNGFNNKIIFHGPLKCNLEMFLYFAKHCQV